MNDKRDKVFALAPLKPTFSSSKQTRNALEPDGSCAAIVGVDRNYGMSGRETLQRKTVSWDLPDFFGLGVNAMSQRSVDSPLENDHDLLDSKVVANRW